MVVSCCAYGCKEIFIKGGPITFHSFPKNDERRKLWEVQLRRENFSATKFSKICSKHFTADCFDRTKLGGTWLKNDAVPTVFYFPNHLQKMSKKRNTPTKCPVSTEDESVDCQTENMPGTSGISDKKQKRLHYLGDFDDYDVTSPSKAKKVLHIGQEQACIFKKKIKNLDQKTERLKKRVASMKDMLEELKNKNILSDTATSVLGVTVSGAATEFIARLQSASSRDEYPPELKTFALTLNFYSAKAYNYVRKTFECNLPHPSTLRRWYKSIDGSPGFTFEALSALKIKTEEASKVNKSVQCGLIVDEMAIRSHVEWDMIHFSGYIDMGTNIDDDQLPHAKEAFTFMVTALNANWKVPVAYFLINGLSGIERANLIKEALYHIHETGVNIVSLTFDGSNSNIACANALGANLAVDNLINFFPHPVTGNKIHLIMDPCHMLKLVRNCLASKGSSIDGNGDFIAWKHIVNLEKLQKEEGLHAATKLRTRHVEWYREKMKVKLAAQVLSRSVADALAYLAFDLKHPTFLDSNATIDFLRKFNDLFDILNSRNLLSKDFKTPLQPRNKDIIIKFLNEAEVYIKNLKTPNGELILSSNRKTGFLGFIICMKSIKSLYYLLCENKPNTMNFLLTYKFSQDHLELFFSAICSKGGHNNNPTVKQFKAAYKRLLVHHQIMTSDSANCIVLDTTNIINVSNSKNIYLNCINETNLSQEDDRNFALIQSIAEDHCYEMRGFRSEYVSDVVDHVAGFVAKKLKNSLKCEECIGSLSDNLFSVGNKLTVRKNRGGLTVPSESVKKICKIAEKIFRTTQGMGKLTRKNIMHFLITQSIKEISERNCNILVELKEHALHHAPLDNHIHFLIKAVLFEYFKIRLYHTGKTITEKLQLNKVRSTNSKLTIFKGQ